jgi:antitoxin ParD1/3/4
MVMATMNISLPDELKRFIDEQVSEHSYGTSSEYIRSLVRKERDVAMVRALLLKGARSAPTQPVDDAYFEERLERVRGGVKAEG